MGYGYFTRIKLTNDILQEREKVDQQEHTSLFNYNWGLDETDLYISYDTKKTKIHAYMFVNGNEIQSIDTFIRGKNYAKKLINHYEKNFKCQLYIKESRPESVNYWKKLGKIID
tara:strand:- start:154 stop:495 length:342 start_codon:yes stop_codon:yes gene_type:complete